MSIPRDPSMDRPFPFEQIAQPASSLPPPRIARAEPCPVCGTVDEDGDPGRCLDASTCSGGFNRPGYRYALTDEPAPTSPWLLVEDVEALIRREFKVLRRYDTGSDDTCRAILAGLPVLTHGDPAPDPTSGGYDVVGGIAVERQ